MQEAAGFCILSSTISRRPDLARADVVCPLCVAGIQCIPDMHTHTYTQPKKTTDACASYKTDAPVHFESSLFADDSLRPSLGLDFTDDCRQLWFRSDCPVGLTGVRGVFRDRVRRVDHRKLFGCVPASVEQDRLGSSGYIVSSPLATRRA